MSTDARVTRTHTSTYRFLGLAAQLALLLVVIRAYRFEQFLNGYLGFFSMCCLTFGAFAVHYWLPFEMKERFWVVVSLGAAFLFLPVAVAFGIIGTGAAIYLIVASPLSYWTRVSLIAAGMACLMFLRGMPGLVLRATHGHSFSNFWPVFGAIFMFRLIIYLYDMQDMKKRPPLTAFLSYFFILPNYFFLLFPVVDYKTMRMGYYRRDIHEMAQQGIVWMCRGIAQLLLYLVVSHVRDMVMMDGIHSFADPGLDDVPDLHAVPARLRAISLQHRTVASVRLRPARDQPQVPARRAA